jgi:hypothetical protein
MPWHPMHPIQDLFLESFSYALQFDMHFYMYSYVDKNFIFVKNECYKCTLRKHTVSWGGARPRSLLTELKDTEIEKQSTTNTSMSPDRAGRKFLGRHRPNRDRREL